MRSITVNSACTILFSAMALNLLQCHSTQAAPITLEWTAPGDDGTIGIATEYDVRYAADSATLIAWANATQLTSEPNPKVGGSAESWATSLPAGTWFIAMKTRDEAFNWSALSNIVRHEIDVTAPAAIFDLRVGP